MKNKKSKYGMYFNHINNDWYVASIRRKTKEFLTKLKERYKLNSLHDVICLLIVNFDEKKYLGVKEREKNEIRDMLETSEGFELFPKETLDLLNGIGEEKNE
jgi:hypothetical protein